jgi:glycosyltransferase involved in cell wall biosynthesis
MKVSLIITTYNWPDALFLVLESVRRQTRIPDEIIIADDGSGIKTSNVINDFKNDFKLNIIHSWQKDIGFRVSRSRNKAIIKSSGDYIILIDGDTILHPSFIKDHIKLSEFGCFVQGSRVMLSKNETTKVFKNMNVDNYLMESKFKKRKNSIRSNLLCKIFSNKNKKIKGIKSCNMAFYKNDCIRVNGFNNDFEGWGREDSEFIVRLINSGIKRKNIRFNLIQFHLWHKENNRLLLSNNELIFNDSIKNNLKWCDNGIKSIEQNES